MRRFLFILFLVINFNGYAQLSFEYKKFSSNSGFYIHSKPHSNQEYDTLGQTKVFDSNHNLQWVINRYFTGETVYVNNGGTKVVFIEPFSDSSSVPIRIYHEDGSLAKFEEKDLKNDACESCNYGWLYSTFVLGKPNYDSTLNFLIFDAYEADDIEEKMDSNNIFLKGEDLFLVTCGNSVFKLNLDKGTLSKTTDDAYRYFKANSVINEVNKYIKYPTEFKWEYGIPETVEGNSFEKALAEHIGMEAYVPDGSPKRKGGVRLELKLLIDKAGKAEILTLETKDEVRKQITEFINQTNFTTTCIPENIDKAVFLDVIFFEKK